VNRQPGWHRLALRLPPLVYGLLSTIVIAAALGKMAVHFSFDTNEGWNAYWAQAAWTGSTLYPAPDSLTLNNYLPLWSYTTGMFGRLLADNIQAGRILAGAAMLVNAVAVSAIVREITGRGRGRGCWFAGAAFLVIFGLFYDRYVAINDPQIAANGCMTLALWLFIRRLDDGPARAALVAIPLMLLAGLLKHSALAVPLSIAIFLLARHRNALLIFAAFSTAGLAVVCAALYWLHGPSLFASVLLSRPYSLSNAWGQALGQIWLYNLLLVAIPYLAWRPSPKARLILIYAIVSFVQGLVFSGGADVDANVFFDFAAAVSIGLGLMQTSVVDTIERPEGTSRPGLLLSAWLAICLIPPSLVLPSGLSELGQTYEAVVRTQQADLTLIKSASGRVACENLAFCYWSGKAFEVDLNNLRTLIVARPDVERIFIGRIEQCTYALIQLDDDWEDDGGPLTDAIRDALKLHYKQSETTEDGVYWVCNAP
jgi:hypothetical protein